MLEALIIISNIVPPIAMFVESRSARPTNLSLTKGINDSWAIDQTEFGTWRSIFYQILLFTFSFSTSSQNKLVKKLAQVVIYCGLCILASLSAPLHAQVPLTPEPPESPETPNLNPPEPPETPNLDPLPNQNNPIDESLIAPPVPESLIDIPGTIIVEQFQFNGSSIFKQTELNKAIFCICCDRAIKFILLG